ncbi:zona pellucida sperm-binding protein 3-like isoform X2 [Gadus macrocephalus]|uniref:zona pellucida sperm-binding protein 3-like isoform X2 n=1 Tax=Gadus macrocephalus TaxID=80720 RepID=UPI0028CB6D7F|nr:zona pellucida sperm-binding protein 3-like isoform X2 [Gadus macrocephalus]
MVFCRSCCLIRTPVVCMHWMDLDVFFSNETEMSTWTYFLCMIVLRFVQGGLIADQSDLQIGQYAGLEIKCEETKMRISAKREFFFGNRIPFLRKCLQLGDNAPNESCRATWSGPGPGPESEMVIDARLRECGTESTVDGDWLIYYNHLVLCPAVPSTTRGSLMLNHVTTLIPVECHYKRRQMVSGQPLTPKWLPMTATTSAYGLLHFSLRTMTGFTAPRSSSTNQQGESVILEAGVEAPQHTSLRVYVDHCVASSSREPLESPGYEFINNHGCLMDSLVPGSSSAFLPRRRDDRLLFSIPTFPFLHDSGIQMYISCHLRATLATKAPDSRNKACFFHSPTFSWCPAEGSVEICACCNSNNCSDAESERERPPHWGERVVRATVGPLQHIGQSH